MKKLIMFGVILVFVLALVSSLNQPIPSTDVLHSCKLYDDFSSGKLNLDRWTEEQDPEGQPFTDEHFVDAVLENYHILHATGGDRRTYLKPTIQFNEGQTLDFNVDYVSGIGNREALIILVNDGRAPNRHGVIGFNNANSPFGNEFGKYHIHIEFFGDLIMISGTGPNNQTFEPRVLSDTASAPYDMFMGSFVNGNIHANFDDFVVCD